MNAYTNVQKRQASVQHVLYCVCVYTNNKVMCSTVIEKVIQLL